MFNKRTQIVNRKATIIIKLVVLKKTNKNKQKYNKTKTKQLDINTTQNLFLPANIIQVNNSYIKN